MVRSSTAQAKAIRELMLELDSAKGRVPTLPIALWQNATTALAALAVVLVALTYLLGVAGLLWLSLDYGISHARLLSVADVGGSVGVYVAISVFTLLIVLLLVKPIFMWGLPEGKPIALDRRDQPDLYEYVDKLSELLGTPKPERIEVFLDANASASMAGFAMGLFSRKPVLSLGLSLVAGTDIQRLTGIIAHELAHFKQGRATRFRLVINAVNSWFARVVYGRDRFDVWVARASSVAVLGLTLIPVSLILLAGRWVLWAFMMIAHAASGLVSRRGEYEADKYMAAVIGSDQIGPTLQRIAVLGLCMDGAREDMRASYMAGRLADDIPALATARADSLSAQREEQVLRLLKLEKQTWHSTHPTLLQRTAAAKELGAKPLIEAPGPSSLLFERFEELCRSQTEAGYRALLGEQMDTIELVPTAEIIKVIESAERANKALVRFYQCEPPLTRPLLPGVNALKKLSDAQAALSRLMQSRSQMHEQMPEYHRLLESLAKVQDGLAEADLALRLMGAGLKAEQIGLRRGLSTKRQLRTHMGYLENEEQAILAELAPHEAVVRQRLGTAVRLLGDPDIAESVGPDRAGERRGLMEQIVPIGMRIDQTMPKVREMARAAEALVGMLQLAGQAGDKSRHRRAVTSTGAELRGLLESVRSKFRNEVYPFDHAQGDVPLGDFVVPRIPEDPKDFEQLVFVVGDTIDRYQTLVAQCMAVSAETAEEVETAAGFAQADEPQGQDPLELLLSQAEREGRFHKDAALSERWVRHLASAAVMCVGILISMVGISSLIPTVNTTVVPRHPYYEPTLVPAAMHDPTQASSFFDPIRSWRVQYAPGPSDPGFSRPLNYNRNSPYYNPHPGYKDPFAPGYNNPHYLPPGYNTPGHPNYRQPGYTNPQNPTNSPHLPGYNPNAPSPGDPGYVPPSQPNYNTPHDPNRNRPNQSNQPNQPNRQPSYPRPSQPSRPTPSRPSAPRGPSSPF